LTWLQFGHWLRSETADVRAIGVEWNTFSLWSFPAESLSRARRGMQPAGSFVTQGRKNRRSPAFRQLAGGSFMDKPAQNIQDGFLNNARKDKIVVTIYLMSGVKLSGRIKSFDKYSMVLETNNQEQLIFKHAISTVVTQKTSHVYATAPQSVAHGSAAGAPSGIGGGATSDSTEA
jgi:host factor-I protein